MSGTVIEEIESARRLLKIDKKDISLMVESEQIKVLDKISITFGADRSKRWWWESFSKPTKTIEGESLFERISDIVPDPGELVYFICEEGQLDEYPVYLTTPEIAQKIIGECYGFEYYIVVRDFSWLLCEDHHHRMHAVGEKVVQRIPIGL